MKLTEEKIEELVHGVQAIAEKHGKNDEWKDQTLAALIAQFE